ncbi:MAG: radical SAM protein [Deltaproteobacteria bacterium]|nr:radical SAM protein [Deltaproteobacteria bacterium]
MGILHRVYAKNAALVWEAETRVIHRLGWVRPPVAVQWIATNACDLTCPHCYSRSGPRLDAELTTDEVKRLVIDELVALGCPSIVIAGGELFLRKDLPELIAYLAGRGLRWSMHTHGRLVPRFRELLAAHPPEMAAVSVDGPPAVHDRFRGRAGAFDDAMRAIATLREIGVAEVVLGTTVTRDNADLVADLYPFVVSSGATSWGLHLFAPEGRGEEHRRLFPTPEQLRRVAAFARRKRAAFHVELDNEWGSAGRDDLFYRDQPFLCGAGRITAVVSATGELMPCTTTDPAESAGNVRAVPLSIAWRRGFTKFRQGGSSCADGRECWLQSRNGNACRALAFPESAAPAPALEVAR